MLHILAINADLFYHYVRFENNIKLNPQRYLIGGLRNYIKGNKLLPV